MNHHLLQVGLNVPDIEASVEHYESVLGLSVLSDTDGEVRLGFSDGSPCVVLSVAGTASCCHMGLATSAENLEQVNRRAEAARLATEAPRHLEGHGLRLRAPNGLAVELVEGEASARNGARRAVGPRVGSLDHLSMTAADLPATIAFFCDVLGFRLSDSVEDLRHWLRCGPNHHTVAVFQGGDGLHHYAFETQDANDLNRLGDVLASRGQNFVWGIGRHGLGANVFSYHLDPAGAVLEVCCGMIQVDDEDSWVSQVWPADTLASALMWGPAPPPEFRQLGIPIADENSR